MNKDLHLKLGKAVYEKAAKDKNRVKIFNNLQKLNNLFYKRKIVRQLNNLSFAEDFMLRETVHKVFGNSLENTVFELLILLIKNQQTRLLRKIFAGYRKHHFEARKIREVKVRTARKLSDDEKEAVIKKLKAESKRVHLTFQSNPELIGGIQIYNQGRLTDYSVQNYLKFLKLNLQT
jgi:F-type H+-transporting ATPase subunit delta